MKLSQVEKDIDVILGYLEICKRPVKTPKGLSEKLDIPYRRVLKALNTVHKIQWMNTGKLDRILSFDGTQYQTFVWSNKWIPPEARTKGEIPF